MVRWYLTVVTRQIGQTNAGRMKVVSAGTTHDQLGQIPQRGAGQTLHIIVAACKSFVSISFCESLLPKNHLHITGTWLKCSVQKTVKLSRIRRHPAAAAHGQWCTWRQFILQLMEAP